MSKNLLVLLLCFACAWLQSQSLDVMRYRTYDGSQNNLQHPEYGAAHTPLLRMSGQGYADGMATPQSEGLPNPREVSNALFAQDGLLNDPVGLSDYTWVFGQFMDHDLSLTELPGEAFNIPVPMGDPQFDPFATGRAEIPLLRNGHIPGTGTAPGNPRQYDNELTAFVDASSVYGSSEADALWLRAFSDGKLKVSAGNMLPYNTLSGEADSPEDPSAPHMANATGTPGPLFVAGDLRANENPLLLLMHLIFVREHNRQCDLLKAAHPEWNDEQLYHHARKIVGGIVQSITYDEWLPSMGVTLPPYQGYDPAINPQMANVFTAAAFRVGHTLLNGNIRRLDENGEVIPQGNQTLREAFFNLQAYEGIGIEPYLRGMAAQTQQRMDSRIVDDIRNFLFGPPGAGGLDLASINIARGRDRGLNTYNNVRSAYGLNPYANFSDINPAPEVYTVLEELYAGDIDKLEPWPAMLAERSADGSIFGPTIRTIMREQFTRLRDGDRFFYLNDPVLSQEEKEMITRMSFRDVIMYNSDIDIMQNNIFVAMPFSELCGSATVGADGWISVHTTNERLADVTVTAGARGETMAVTTSSDLGFFTLSDLPACAPTVLIPAKTDGWLPGIDIVDVVAIRRNLLGIETFTNPYQYLAADANEDGDLNVQDVVALTRLLLDIDEALVPGSTTPWRFVARNYTFQHPEEPFRDTERPDRIDFEQVKPVDINQGFIAYKLGDVNANAAVNSKAAPALEVAVPLQSVMAGESVTFNVRIRGEEVAGFDLNLTAKGLAIQRVIAPDFPEGTVVFNQSSVHIVTVEEDAADHVLTIEAMATQSLSHAAAFHLDAGPQALAVDHQGHPRSIALTQTNTRVVGADAGAIARTKSRVFPNPFQSTFTLALETPLMVPATLQLHDLTGREIYREQWLPGQKQFVVQLPELPNGSYFVQLIAQDGTLVTRHRLTH